jgi:hypothetical protein
LTNAEELWLSVIKTVRDGGEVRLMGEREGGLRNEER